ncbi:MAG: hypothetical protein PUI39_01190 [Prevotella sp.]|nr:hypothetical protein [Prevotella sp.]
MLFFRDSRKLQPGHGITQIRQVKNDNRLPKIGSAVWAIVAHGRGNGCQVVDPKQKSATNTSLVCH